MSYLCFYFQAHQPRRLKKKPTASSPFDDALNKQILLRVAEKSYLPANDMFDKLVLENPEFRICLSISGSLLDQARMFHPTLLKSFQRLAKTARETGRIEFLGETYHHSLCGLFKDGNKAEFRDQIHAHSDLMKELLGIVPTSFRNTELMYNDSVGQVAADLGFKSIICELRPKMYKGNPLSTIFKDKHGRISLLPRHYELSGELAYSHSTVEGFAEKANRQEGQAIVVGMDYEAVSERQWTSRIFEMWQALPAAIAKRPNLIMRNPTEIAAIDDFAKAPSVSIDPPATTSWVGDARNVNPWTGNRAQQMLFDIYQDFEAKVKLSSDTGLLATWRELGTSDNYYYMHSVSQSALSSDSGIHDYYNHFVDSTEAIAVYATALTNLTNRRTRRTQDASARRKARRPRILLVTPEITELTSGFGKLANVISVKGGGLADISAALIDELAKLDLDIHVTLPKYERQMLEYAEISRNELDRLASTFKGQKRIHLVQDAAFSHVRDVYATDGGRTPLDRAIAFQEKVINFVLSETMPSHGKMLVHCNDWMTGLIPAAARARGLKSLFTVHNLFTGKRTLRDLEHMGIDVSQFAHDLYLDQHPDTVGNDWNVLNVDFLLSGIKASDFVNTVSPTFLQEIVNGYFQDLVSWQTREEFRAKYHAGCASGILNSPKSNMDPAIGPGMALHYDESSFVEGKAINKRAFQEKMGLRLDPNAPIMFWPHRLYSQKGPELLAAIAQPLIDHYHQDGLQIAIVANGDPQWEHIYGQISCASHGRIAYSKFNPRLSELGKAGSDFILMPSLYEPCGLPQMEGMRYGTLPIVRATGGLKDSVTHLDIAKDIGNGFVFNDFTSDALWWACVEAMNFFRSDISVRNRIIRRVMNEGMNNFNIERTTLEYVRIYEKLLGEKLI
ncbi:MAG: glycosyltransferase [Myxococcales bacterium]|jgi:ADP-glucose type glycogen/starch synthase|nr:glycosyltransferase [Myxococcales bacterium]